MEKKIYEPTVDGDEIYTLIVGAQTNKEYLVKCPICGKVFTVKWEKDDDIIVFGYLADEGCEHIRNAYTEYDGDGWIYWREVR